MYVLKKTTIAELKRVQDFITDFRVREDKWLKQLVRKSGIYQGIDGYGLMPYKENEISFIPQLFYKLYSFPFGIQVTQIHLNYWKQKDFESFENFIKKNRNNFITYEEVIKKVNNNFIFKILNFLIRGVLRIKRFF